MVSFEDFKKIEMKIGTVLEVRDHPGADRLYVVKVSLGEEQREVVAGIKQHYSPDELVGRQVVVAANIAPAVIRGVESRGMLLAASGAGSMSILTVMGPVEDGSPVG